MTIQSELRESIEALRQGQEPTDYSRKLKIRANTVAVLSDLHIPKHSDSLLERFVLDVQEQQPDYILLLGDLLDMEEFSGWGVEDYAQDFARNLESARLLIRLLLDYSPRTVVVWSEGNHEARFFRKSDNRTTMQMLGRLTGLQAEVESGRVIITDNPTVLAEVGGVQWMFTHPKSYGPTPLVVPSKLATRFQTNVVSAHAHHWGMTRDEGGNFYAIEAGGGFDPRQHKYIQQAVTTHRAWVNGYVMIRGGVPELTLGDTTAIEKEKLFA